MTKQIDAREDHCIDCRYYMEDPDLETSDVKQAKLDGEEMLTGWCRRYPPTIFLSYPEPISRHPDVAGETDWCGEFTPKS